MRKEHAKCMEIMFHLKAHIEPNLLLRHVPKHVSIYPNQHKKETEENECLPNDNKHQFFKKKTFHKIITKI